MKNALIKSLASLAVAFAVVATVKADPVTGGIDFGNFGQPGATVVDNLNNTSTLSFDHEQISGVSCRGHHLRWRSRSARTRRLHSLTFSSAVHRSWIHLGCPHVAQRQWWQPLELYR